MISAGIDIGSRSIELVLVEKGSIIQSKQCQTGYAPIKNIEQLLNGLPYDRIMATGYGRNLFEIAHDAPTVTEIKAYAIGARATDPSIQTILDIGGQDSKVISLAKNGAIKKFEMNDRCAAGTGKFLEIIAKSLDYPLRRLGTEALKSSNDIQINSMCAVFAESEVISLVAKGVPRQDIAKGLHNAVVKRATTMLKRVGVGESVFFAGGVAKNQCIVSLLEKSLGCRINVPENPQMIGAFGAALLAGEQ